MFLFFKFKRFLSDFKVYFYFKIIKKDYKFMALKYFVFQSIEKLFSFIVTDRVYKFTTNKTFQFEPSKTLTFYA